MLANNYKILKLSLVTFLLFGLIISLSFVLNKYQLIKVANANNSPAVPVKSFPPDQAINQEYTNLNLTWQSATDPDGDPITYNVYYGTSASQLILISACNQIIQTSCLLAELAPLTTYFWDVVAYDNFGAFSHVKGAEIFRFTTKSAPAGPEPIFTNLPTEKIIFDKRIIFNPPPGFTKLKTDVPKKQIVPD